MSNITRRHVEHYILGSVINGNISMPLDAIEFQDFNIEYELFKSSFTVKMVAKAIYNMKLENIPIDDVLVMDYIEKRTNKLNVNEFYEIVCAGTGSYLSVLNYTDLLKKIDKEEEIWSRL